MSMELFYSNLLKCSIIHKIESGRGCNLCCYQPLCSLYDAVFDLEFLRKEIGGCNGDGEYFQLEKEEDFIEYSRRVKKLADTIRDLKLFDNKEEINFINLMLQALDKNR